MSFEIGGAFFGVSKRDSTFEMRWGQFCIYGATEEKMAGDFEINWGLAKNAQGDLGGAAGVNFE